MREQNLHSAASSLSPLSFSAVPLSACSAPRLAASSRRLKEMKIVRTGGETLLLSSVLTNSSSISLVCTAAPLPPGVADTVGGGGGVAPVVSPGQGLEVGLHEPLSSAHLVHTLHAEGKQ